MIPAERKVLVVLSVLASELTVAEAARREKVSEQSIVKWKRQFLEAGRTAPIEHELRFTMTPIPT